MITNRVALITGAASGIGAELARVFASRGHPVALVDLSPDRSRNNGPGIICGRHSADPDSLRP